MMQTLIVDNDNNTSASLAALLERWGHEAYCASSGEMALEKAPRLKPDLTFVDLAVPQVNGISLARQLRTMPELAATTLIAVSDAADEGHRGQAAVEGYDDFLPKPYSAVNLAQILARVRAKVAVSWETAQRTHHAVAKAKLRIAASRQSLDDYWRDRREHESLPCVWFLGCEADLRRAILHTSPDGEAANRAFDSGEACLTAIDAEDRSHRECLLIDDTNAYVDALEVLTRFSLRGASLPAIVLVAEGDVRRAVELMRAGAFEVIERNAAIGEIGETVLLAIENETFADQPARTIASMPFGGAQLSERECRLLQLTVEGMPNKQIARAMDISLRTVHLHRAALMKKLSVRSRAELIRIAVQGGL